MKHTRRGFIKLLGKALALMGVTSVVGPSAVMGKGAEEEIRHDMLNSYVGFERSGVDGVTKSYVDLFLSSTLSKNSFIISISCLGLITSPSFNPIPLATNWTFGLLFASISLLALRSNP